MFLVVATLKYHEPAGNESHPVVRVHVWLLREETNTCVYARICFIRHIILASGYSRTVVQCAAASCHSALPSFTSLPRMYKNGKRFRFGCSHSSVLWHSTSNRPPITHDPHDASHPDNLHQFLMPTQQHAHGLSASSLAQIPRLHLTEPRRLR